MRCGSFKASHERGGRLGMWGRRSGTHSPAPMVHAATKRVRKELRAAYGWFLAAFREAADKLKKGDRDAPFPHGSFPPHLPFVPA